MRPHHILLLLLTSCSVNSGIQTNNSSSPYDYESTPLHISTAANTSTSQTTIYIQLDRSELLYTRENPQSSFVSKVIFNFLDQTTQISDTLYSDCPKLLNIELKTSPVSDIFTLEVIDLNRKTSVKTIVEPKSYLIWDKANDWAVSNNYVAVGTEIEIITPEKETWYVRTVDPDNFLPDPPFTGGRNNFDRIKDSLNEQSNGEWTVVNGSQRLTSSNGNDDIVIYGRSAEFPEMIDVYDLIEATRYISTISEYKNLTSASHPKQALDDFWMKCGDTPEKSRDLIKTYYGRVEESNRYFSGLLEGWRTDRGMVHIIMGPPNQIRRDYWNEFWIYGDQNSTNNITFRFMRKEHPIDSNIYMLERNSSYRITWEQFVTSWRNGRVYGD